MLMTVKNACGMPADVRYETLTVVYKDALQHDPVWQQAKADHAASQEGVVQSRSVLLPSLTGAVNTSSVKASFLASDHAMNQHAYGLTLKQPLLHVSDWVRLDAAHALARQADALYAVAFESLIMRVCQTYFKALLANDVLRFTQHQEASMAAQLRQVRYRYQVGMATMTDVYQIMAAHEALNAQVINAGNAWLNALQALTVLTHRSYTGRLLAPFQDDLPLIKPVPENAQAWVDAAQKNNGDFLSAHYAEQAAKENVHTYQAAHLPSVDAVGSYQRGNDLSSGQTDGGTSSQWQSSIGLQVSVPIYQGGYGVSKTREAQAQYLSAEAQTESARRLAAFLAQQAFNNVLAGVFKIKADRLSVLSAESARKSTALAYQAGTKTVLDVLNAEQAVYAAKTQLASDQYDYLLNTLLLKQAAGRLSASDIMALSRWLVT